MIRFVAIGGQIIRGEKDFAFFDTVTDNFITINGYQVFDSMDELVGRSELIVLVPDGYCKEAEDAN